MAQVERRFESIYGWLDIGGCAPDYERLVEFGFHFAHVCDWEADRHEMWNALHSFRE